MKGTDQQIDPGHRPLPNRRDTEASALRDLFREQWRQLRGRIQRYEAFRSLERQRSEALDQAVEQVVSGTDRRLRGVSRYRKRLRQSTRCLLNYIGECVHQLPAAHGTDRATYYRDETLQTLLGGYDLLRRLLADDPVLAEYRARQPAARQRTVYALLACSEHRHHISGSAIRGDMLVRDVLQEHMEFGNHRLVTAAATESDLRNALKRMLFEQVVAYLKDYMARLRHGRLSERERRELPYGGEGIESPQRYLEVLEWLLSLPLELVRIQSERLNLDRMGILQPPPGGHEPVRIDALTIGDRPSQALCLLRIDGSKTQAG